MFKYLKLFVFLFALILNSNANAKPVPPGAGDGDVKANILFLVDSSASMGRWIGGDGLGIASGITYDSQGRILIGQQGRRTMGGLIRYTAAGERDTNFTPIRGIPAAGCAQQTHVTNNFRGRNSWLRRTSTVKFLAGLTSTVINNENIIFMNSRERRSWDHVLGFSEDGTECRFALRGAAGQIIYDFDIKTINGTPYIFMSGGHSRRSWSFFKSCNLTNMQCTQQDFTSMNDITRRTMRLSVNNEGTIIYFSSNVNGDLVGHSLVAAGAAFELGAETRRCTAVNDPNLTSEIMFATGVEVSPDDSDIIYITSHFNHAVQKLQFDADGTAGTTDDDTCEVVTSVGTGTASISSNSGTSGALAADNINFNQPWGLHVTSTRILTATSGGYVDEFNEDLFTAAQRNTTWLQQMGGPRLRRWDGVKQAINAIVNDSTLTTGAYFGFGHWNAGENGGPRGRDRGGRYCHRNSDCTYYQGWGGFNTTFSWVESKDADGNVITTTTTDPITGVPTESPVLEIAQSDTGSQTRVHPNGTSSQCNRDSCLNVAVSPGGADLIMGTLNPLGMAWGTDSHAFSQIAYDYFKDSNAGGSIVDPDSECQLNYVIVIGDGAMTNTGVEGAGGQTADRMEALRKMGVKSLYVAYGGGITGTNLDRFHALARIGSSELSASATAQECIDDEDCERAIIANTPEDLKSDLTSKIRQIIADKLAFTAPSISATIQKGGSIYQAQFAYEQYGEWRGTILKKFLKPGKCDDTNTDTSDDCVEHNTSPGNTHGNWSAATMIKGQSTAGGAPDTRKLWTAWSPGDTYAKSWDNFNTGNSTALKNMFDKLGYTIPDYHHSTSDCPAVGADTNLGDEVKGLINFMKGNDYFDYNANCDVEEVRAHVMGDIYHSQLIEVGPPDANISFTNTNQEAYYRATNNYQGFMTQQANRKKIVYAGSNSGVFHAINEETGKEQWGFIPPFIGSLLPQIINKNYDGKVDGGGGTNPIFGVDGSPVVHDVFIRGYNQNLGLSGTKSWRTLAVIPYGRGGAGFSVLDITEPGADGGKGPIHMFSIFNDRINQKILRADVNGFITEFDYNAGSGSLLTSLEGEVATDNFQKARDEDEKAGDDVFTEQNAIAACSTSSDFRNTGTASCYKGKTFHFPEIILEYALGTEIPDGVLSATQLVGGVPQALPIKKAKMVDDGVGGAILQLTFDSIKAFNANQSDTEPTISNQISITACLGASGLPAEYDYSQLGETWSTPKIARIPTSGVTGLSSSGSGIEGDRYVAIFGAGMAKNDACSGSAVFLVDLEGHVDGEPGSIFGAQDNGGPITIVDTSPSGLTLGQTVLSTPNGSDITNAIPASPVVITPDTAPNIPWRGALVYINDLEGKITKINLTNNTKGYNPSATVDTGNLIPGTTEMFDQTTLFNLKASQDNGRYSYFSMDAGLGLSDGGFWLFGSTGNFTDLGGRANELDNILYGIKDEHYPYWAHLNSVTIPTAVESPGAVPMKINPEFIKLANQGASSADNIDNSTTCVNTSGDSSGSNCPLKTGARAWVAHLEQNDSGSFVLPRTFRKASAPPTLFKGQVYYPIYQPPPGANKCDQGNAFICAADDECGTNTSAQLDELEFNPVDDDGVSIANPSDGAVDLRCGFVRKGVLSELVVFGDKLYANVAGPSDDASTLFSILSIPGEIITNKGGWRDSSF